MTPLPKFLYAMLSCLLISAPVSAEDILPKFTVSGTGEVAEAPDMATITLGVAHEADTAAEALGRMRDGSAAVFAALAPFEIEPRDLQTSQLSLTPQWERYKLSGGGDRQRIAGYLASNLVTVRVRDLHQLGAIMDAVADSGANRFQGLQFGFADPKPLMDQARAAAIADARRKAADIADAADIVLGRILSMNEHGNGIPRPQVLAEADFARSAMPVAAGELNLSVTFSITYELLNK